MRYLIRLSTLLLVMIMAVLVTGCDKDEVSLRDNQYADAISNMESEFKFTKQIDVFDRQSESRISLIAGSNSKDFLEAMDAEDVTFIIVDENPKVYLDRNDYTETDENNADSRTDTNEPEASISYGFEVFSEELGDKTQGYGLRLNSSSVLEKMNKTGQKSSVYLNFTYYAGNPQNTIQYVNTTCHTTLAKFCSKKYRLSSYSCSNSNGGQRYIAQGGYWIFCRDNKYKLRVSTNYDSSCQNDPTAYRWTQYGGC